MGVRGYDLRCCCSSFVIVEVPLVRKAGYYTQQTNNGVGPFRIDGGAFGGDWLAITTVPNGSQKASTGGYILFLRGVIASRLTLNASWQPTSNAINGVDASYLDYRAFRIGTVPAYLAGSAAVWLGKTPVARVSASLMNVQLPIECSYPVYGQGIPYAWDLQGIPRFDGNDGGEVLHNGEWSFENAKLGSIAEFPRDGIENLWVPHETLSPQVPWDFFPTAENVTYENEADIIYFDGRNEDIYEAWPKNIPPPLLGYASWPTLSFGGSTRWIYSDGLLRSFPVSIISQRRVTDGLCTGFVYRGDRQFAGMSQQYMMHIEHAPGRHPMAQPGYTHLPPVSVGGQFITVVWEGESMLKTAYPTQAQLASAMTKDGSYLIMSNVEAEHAPPGEHPGSRPRWLTDYRSFVIDSEPPVVGFVPVNDKFVDEIVSVILFGGATLFASEPLVDERPDAGRFRIMGGHSLPIGPGQYTAIAFTNSEVSDRAGNNPKGDSGWQTVTVHPVPLNPSARGARAEILFPDSQCGMDKYRRGGPLDHVILSFDKPIADNSDTGQKRIRPENFAFLRDGVSLGAVSVVEFDELRRKFRVNLPTAGQVEGYVYTLTWTPDERVLTRDRNPVSWAQEPCVLAARTAWIIMPAIPAPELIDTTSYDLQLGRVVSESADVDAEDLFFGTPTIENSNGMMIDVAVASGDESLTLDQRVVGVGSFATAEDEGFVPQVPVKTSGVSHPRCSYWGLPTTIDPCPPGFVSPCAGPIVPQKHSSVIRTTGDITAFQVSLVVVGPEGDVKLNPPVYGPDVAESNEEGYVINPPSLGDFYGWRSGSAMREIMAVTGEPYVFTNTRLGAKTSQNTWSCVEPARRVDEGFILAPAYTSSYRLTNTANPFTSGGWFVGGFDPTTIDTVYAPNTRTPREVMLQESGHFFYPGLFNVVKYNVRAGDLPGIGSQLDWDEHYGVFDRITGPGVDPRWKVRQAKSYGWQDGMQAVASAFRQARVFPGMATTTLSELVMTLSFRMTIAMSTDFEDREYVVPNPATYPPFTFAFYPNTPSGGGSGPGLGGGGGGGGGGIGPDTLGTVRVTHVAPALSWEQLSIPTGDDGEPNNTRSGIIRRGYYTENETLVFTDEQEQAFVNGSTVEFACRGAGGIPLGFVGGALKWRIKRV